VLELTVVLVHSHFLVSTSSCNYETSYTMHWNTFPKMVSLVVHAVNFMFHHTIFFIHTVATICQEETDWFLCCVYCTCTVDQCLGTIKPHAVEQEHSSSIILFTAVAMGINYIQIPHSGCTPLAILISWCIWHTHPILPFSTEMHVIVGQTCVLYWFAVTMSTVWIIPWKCWMIQS